MYALRLPHARTLSDVAGQGDIVNSNDVGRRAADPCRLLQGYMYSAAVLNYLRAMIGRCTLVHSLWLVLQLRGSAFASQMAESPTSIAHPAGSWIVFSIQSPGLNTRRSLQAYLIALSCYVTYKPSPTPRGPQICAP